MRHKSWLKVLRCFYHMMFLLRTEKIFFTICNLISLFAEKTDSVEFVDAEFSGM